MAIARKSQSAGSAADANLVEVRRIVMEKLRPYAVQIYLVGSHARGNATPVSDIDVAVLPGQPLPSWVLPDLREALFESTVPYEVDVIDLSQADAEFRRRVLVEAVSWSD